MPQILININSPFLASIISRTSLKISDRGFNIKFRNCLGFEQRLCLYVLFFVAILTRKSTTGKVKTEFTRDICYLDVLFNKYERFGTSREMCYRRS